MTTPQSVDEQTRLPKLPKDLAKYGRSTIYAGADERKERLAKLLQIGNGGSLSKLVDLAVQEFLQRSGHLTGEQAATELKTISNERR